MPKQLELFDLTPYTVLPTKADVHELDRRVLVLKTLDYQQLELNLFPEETQACLCYSFISVAA
jgi:hypothetical protein